ncbi:CaiB/BaiF CoA transferase family protein [Sinimarinibacterium flocculans]|uniref:Crotonobetainyl-CoA:carnitine CoA-transferase CaiB-like acyl-CoA transferase n=1 Tax=Sinimarinibacterium flocculans TaxID=985250 RepID=A0A318EDN5_9GAMM|nr:CoA transferase [Sinimarinibacterium flocculans]PXV68350.1 crotonobetainyl-CoA:carnitine CoA-transferase CaiB-like acyl-CoA transferase [Sinimarinibacterium flocculans]
MGNPTQRSGPLAGVRVVDLTAMVMGPYCTQIMADMGADVIKIEPPDGDGTRYISIGPSPTMGGVFANVNRGKRSVVLDLQTDAGREALRRLIADADVFIHTMRAKAIARLGFAYDDVTPIKPDIVYTNAYGYSRRGPDRDLPAYDDTIQAECGLTAVQQMLTGEANYVGSIVADKVAGLTALYATVMALFHRERTGEGQEVEVGMFETMASFMLVEHANGAMFSPPLSKAHYPRAVARNRKPYRTKDGHISALIYNDKMWAKFVDAVKPSWAGPELATLKQRAKQIDRVYGLLGDTFLERTTAEWLELLQSLGIPAAPLRTPDELFDNAHLNAVGFFETVESEHGPVRFPGVPTWFSRTPGRVAGPAPELGTHTQQVLDEAGVGATVASR